MSVFFFPDSLTFAGEFTQYVLIVRCRPLLQLYINFINKLSSQRVIKFNCYILISITYISFNLFQINIEIESRWKSRMVLEEIKSRLDTSGLYYNWLIFKTQAGNTMQDTKTKADENLTAVNCTVKVGLSRLLTQLHTTKPVSSV